MSSFLRLVTVVPHVAKELCRCDLVKDLEMGRLSWCIPYDPKEEEGGAESEREEATLLVLKIEEGAQSQGVRVASRAGKGQETDSALEPPGGTEPVQCLDFSLVKLSLDFRRPGLSDTKCVLL